MSEVVLNVVLNGVAIQVTNLVYFFKMAPGMVTSLNTSIGNKSRSTTDFDKGRQGVVPIAIKGLASLFLGRGVRRIYFYGILLFAPDSPSPSACRFTKLVWFRMAFDPTLGKT